MATQTSVLDTQPQTDDLHEHLRFYYGQHLKRTSDLSQKACCTDETENRHAEVLKLIPDEVKERHYGCGCPIPDDELTGLSVLDLGSGAGVDAFIVSHKVGATGFVHGIDMTHEQLEVANRHAAQVAAKFRI